MNRTLTGFAMLLVPLAAAGATPDSYPSRPVRVLVQGPPGTAPDVLARTVTHKLAVSLVRPFIVDNRPGAGGIVAAQTAIAAPPDGHTLLIGASGSMTIAPFLAAKPPYDPARDLAHVTLLANAPLAITAHPSLPATSVKELIAVAKTRPGQLAFASTGVGSVQHLTIELFSREAGISVNHIGYKGGGPAVTAVLGGESQLLMTALPPVLPHIKAARLRAIAMTSLRRSSAAPEIPTVAESGIPRFESSTWYGVFAPANTPVAIVDKLYGEIRKLTESADVKTAFARDGLELAVEGRRALAETVRGDTAKWRRVIREAQLTAD